jgi:Rieske Fe-S protein
MSQEISRRRFIEGVAALTGIALVGCSQQSEHSAPGGPPPAAGPQASAGANGTIELANVGELAKGQGTAFTFPDGAPGILFCDQNGKTGAVNAVCPHAKCTVGWRPEETATPIVCPCHNSRFDTSGQVKGGPAPTNLSHYSVTIQSGKAILKPT